MINLVVKLIISTVIIGENIHIAREPDTKTPLTYNAADNVVLSRVRNQENEDAECWDLLNQRWTQIVSEGDTGGMVTVMKVDLPNGCKQLAHVHCGLHEAFYKVNDNGQAVWASAKNGNWQEVSPQMGDFSYASMGTGHGYTNANVSSCSGDTNVASYTSTSYTSHFVIKMPGFEHETRARTVPYGNTGGQTCNMMTNRIETGYSDAAKAAIGSYGATDPKFIPALLTLDAGGTYAPSHATVKPIQYTPSTDMTVVRPSADYAQYGQTVSGVRRLMSLNSWTTAVDKMGDGTAETGTGGVAQMDEVKFSGKGTSKKAADGKVIVFMVVHGDVTLKTGTVSRSIPNLSGFVLKAGHTAPWRIDCESSTCTVLELKIGDGFSTSFMHDAGYGVPWNSYVTDATADYVTSPWGPSKNTYQQCIAPNDETLAPNYKVFTQQTVPTGAQNRSAVFSCYMSCVSSNGFTTSAHDACRSQFPLQQIVVTSTACPHLYASPYD